MRPSPRGLAPMLLFVVLAALAVSVSSAGQQRVVCYYTNWSVYRPGNAKFNPQNINPYLCTHLIYAFGGLSKENGLRPFDKYQDIEQGGYAKFNGLKTYNKQLKTMLAIGGWNEGSTRFSPLVADSERRAEFVKNVVRFLRQNNFDGLDLDWEYPAFRDGGKPRDRANYAQLVQELRAEFDRESSKTGRERLLLTMAVPAGINYIDKGYDVPSLNRDLDFMNILSYDYHSAFEPVVNHHAPLYSGGDPDNEYNYDADLSIEATIKHYVTLGADRDKLVLGIPTYGRSYTLFNPLATELGSAADGPGEQGDATREKGYLAYYEICESVKKSGWTVERPRPDDMGPIAYKENQWVGYDDEDIVRVKARYVAAQGLGGIMFWSIDNDDFRGKCHDRPYPLIEAGKEALLDATKSSDGKRTKPTSSSSSRRQRPTSSSSSNSAPATSSSSKRRRPSGSSSRSSTTTSTSTTTPVPPNLSLLNTPEPPTTPDPGSDFVCKDEGFFPHPRDCKKYFWCLDSGPSELGIVAHQFTCPSGLVFNKLADSCDYARNVICSKTKPASSTTTSTTTSTTAAPVSTTRSPLFRPITTTTTTTTTTPAPEEEDYDEEEFEEDFEEDPKAIKELLDLIKRLGGVEQLEKQFGGSGRSGGDEVSSAAPVKPNISKSLYERVLSGRSRISNSGGPAVDSTEQRRPSSQSDRRTPSTSFTSRSRGPQNQGLDNLEEVKSLRKDKPKYVELRRPSVRRPVSEEVEDDEDIESQPEEEESEEAVVPVSRPSFRASPRPNTVPKYTSIRRSTTPAAPRHDSEEEDEEEEQQQQPTIKKQPAREEQPKRKYVSLNRARPTVGVKQTEEEVEEVPSGDVEEDQVDQDEVPALVREVPAPRQALEFEGRVEEIKQVGYRLGNALRRQIHTAELTSVTSPQKEEETAEPSSTTTTTTTSTTTQRATAGFFITRPPSTPSSSSDRTQRVFVVNAEPQTTTTTTTEKLPETTLTTEQPTTTSIPLTEESITEAITIPVSVTTQAPVATTSTVTRVVTSITESPIIGRTIILINRKLNFSLSSLFPKSEPPTTPMAETTTPIKQVSEVSEEVTEVTTIAEPVEISTEPTSTTSAPITKRTKRPTVIRRRPFTPKTQEKTTTDKPKRRRIIPTRNSLEIEPITESSVPTGSTRRIYKQRVRFTTPVTTEASATSAVTRRRFRPTTEATSRDVEEVEHVENPNLKALLHREPSDSFRPRRPSSTTEAAVNAEEETSENARTPSDTLTFRQRRPSTTEATVELEDEKENSNLSNLFDTLSSRQRRPSTTEIAQTEENADEINVSVRTPSENSRFRQRRPSSKEATSHEENTEENTSVRTISDNSRFRLRRPSSKETNEEESQTPRKIAQIDRSRSRYTTEASDDTAQSSSTLRTPSRKRKIIRYKSRTTTTTTTTEGIPEFVAEDIPNAGDDDDDDPRVSASGNEVFLLSSSQNGPNPDEVVDEENEILSPTNDEQQNNFEVSTSTTTAAPVVSSSRPAVSIRPLTRRPFTRIRSTTTASPNTEEVNEDIPSSSAKPRVQVVRRKFRPFKNVEKSRDAQAESTTSAVNSSPRSSLIPRRRPSKTSTTEQPFSSTTAVGETSPLLNQQSPAVYYTRQPIDEPDTHTEVITAPDHDLDLANVAVAALTNLATSPPSSPSYDEDFVDEELEPVSSTTTTTTPRPTSAPRKTQRVVERLPQPKPFTRVTSRGSQRQQSPSSPKPVARVSTTQQPISHQLDFEDYYDDENPALNPQTNKVKIHEDGSLECLDRGNFAHPFSCRKFISCALMENGALLGWIYTCPKHLAFDPIGGICNWSGGCKE